MNIRPVLRSIENPSDVRKLQLEVLPALVQQLREELVEAVSKTGGHLASGLGAVELITGIHYVFDLSLIHI